MPIDNVLKQCADYLINGFKDITANHYNLLLIPLVGFTFACSSVDYNQNGMNSQKNNGCKPSIEEVTDCVNPDTRNNSQYCHSNIVVDNCGSEEELSIRPETNAEGLTVKSITIEPKRTIFLVGGLVTNCQPGYNEFDVAYSLRDKNGDVISTWPRDGEEEKIILYRMPKE